MYKYEICLNHHNYESATIVGDSYEIGDEFIQITKDTEVVFIFARHLLISMEITKIVL